MLQDFPSGITLAETFDSGVGKRVALCQSGSKPFQPQAKNSMSLLPW